jgi:hypothetical protein
VSRILPFLLITCGGLAFYVISALLMWHVFFPYPPFVAILTVMMIAGLIGAAIGVAGVLLGLFVVAADWADGKGSSS